MSNTQQNYIVGIGEALWDMLPEGRKIGGAPANFTFHVSQFGLDAVAVSAVGDDTLGEEIRQTFEQKGLQTQLATVSYPTGTVEVTLDEKGIRANVELWGYDVNHDWPWWYKQCDYYVPQIIY